PHQQLDHRAPTVDEHEYVAAERVAAEHLADHIRESIEGTIEPHRLRRHVDLHRARKQQHHPPRFVVASITRASQTGSIARGSSTSISISPVRNTSTGLRARPVTTTGANEIGSSFGFGSAVSRRARS